MKKIMKNWLKHLLQWGVLAAIVLTIVIRHLSGKAVDPEAYCPFGGLEALGSYLNNHSLACSMSMLQIMMGVVLAVGVILFGKLFCGYLCPLGTLSETMGRMGKKLGAHCSIRSGSVVDSALRLVKYALLFVVLYFSITSSELFCKNLDPYYALATGFKGEITAWMASISIVLLFLGSVFISQFWCRYICPLGALSNIFKFLYIFVIAALACWIFGLLGMPGAWVYILAATCLVCYLIEIITHRSYTFPLLYIKRDDEACNRCGLCEKKCPQEIAVTDYEKLRHVDCTLCGNCVSNCNRNALSINGRKSLRWIPGLIVVVLFFGALWLGGKFELPTIDEKWGDWESVENLQTYDAEGLMSIKCFGSATAFKSKMENVPGVYGVAAYVKRHTVVITYDPAQIDTVGIQKAMFTPTMRKYHNPEDGVERVKVIRLGIEGMRDRMDGVYFGMILQQFPEIYGFDAEFACPVDVRVFVREDAQIDKRVLRDSIEVKNLIVKDKSFPVNFSLERFADDGETISADEFMSDMFRDIAALSDTFDKGNEAYLGDNVAKATYRIAFPDVEKPFVRRYVPYFQSHMSDREGIMAVNLVLDGRTPSIDIVYVPALWDDAKIWELVSSPMWTIHYSDGTDKQEDAKFSFAQEGKTIE